MLKNINISIEADGSLYIDRKDDVEQYIRVDRRGNIIAQDWNDTSYNQLKIMKVITEIFKED